MASSAPVVGTSDVASVGPAAAAASASGTPTRRPALAHQLSQSQQVTPIDIFLVDDGLYAEHAAGVAAGPVPIDGVFSDAAVELLPPSTIKWHAPTSLLSALALMGIKPLHAHRTAHTATQQILRRKRAAAALHQQQRQQAAGAEATVAARQAASAVNLASSAAGASTFAARASPSSDRILLLPLLFGPTPLLADSCVVLLASCFHSIVHAAILRCIKHSNIYHHQLYGMCREITERRRSLIILLAGTSGTGQQQRGTKSTKAHEYSTEEAARPA